ncbi:hypothetical protein [Niameybacter massiliensis]|uniref:hypothetical protein n=1 Tax=Niameybacter massiliensis TaxID=1658108 RepID=UPI0006B68CAC|nr:hypothetical protein [Niameybacter massiliensis]
MRLLGLKPYKLKKGAYEKDDELNDVLVGYEQISIIQANIQPCKGVTKAQLYGSEITKYLSVIMHPNLLVQEDLYIEYEGVHYAIQPISKWKHWSFDMKAVI